MHILNLKSAYYISEEGGSGTSEYPEIPCQMIVASQYISSLGFDVTMRDLFHDEEADFTFAGYDVTVVWVPIIGIHFHTGIHYLEKAKQAGCITIIILNDAFEGLERECLERYPCLDFAIRLYERELVLGRLLNCIQKGESYESLAGLIFRKNGELVDTGLHPCADNLHHLKAADSFLHQLHLERYSVGKIEAARGCPFTCVFCQYNKTKRRARRVEDIIKEIKVLEGRYHLVWLHELNMLLDREFTTELCNAIISEGIKVNWSTDARMESCRDVELLKLLKKSGCGSLDFGLECTNEEIRNTHIRKMVTNETIHMAITNCLTVGIKPSINLMIGSPWESIETMKETEKFIERYPYVDNIQMARPQRGTPLYEICRAEGLLVRELTLDDYIASRDYPTCPTLHMSREELYRWFWRLSIKVISRHALERLKRLGFRKFLQQILAKSFKAYYFRVVLNILKKKLTSRS